MNERIIELTEIGPKEFFGAQNSTIQQLKKYFPKIKIVARGSKLKVYGEPEILDEFDLLNKNMSKEGMQRFAAYLKLHPVMTKILKRRVIFALLNEFALEKKIEEELTLAGWTKDLMDDMTDVCE